MNSCTCGKELHYTGKGRHLRYCSEACKQKAKRVRANEKRVEALREQRSQLFIVQIDLAVANEFVYRFHRHNKPLPGSKLNLGVTDEAGLLRGVAIIGRPVARMLDDGWTLEVNRVTTDGCPNAGSALYAAARTIVFTLGYRRLVTYTLQEESGASMRGAGWKRVSETRVPKGQGWLNRERRKDQQVYNLAKYRWEALPPKRMNQGTFAMVIYPWDILRDNA